MDNLRGTLALAALVAWPSLLMGDSFLTSPRFYAPEPILIGPWTPEMIYGLKCGDYMDVQRPDLAVGVGDIVGLLNSTDEILSHMYLLQTAYYLDLNGFLSGGSLMDTLRLRCTASQGDPLAAFDLGFAMVLMENDSRGLEYLEGAVEKIGTPEAHLGYGLAVFQAWCLSDYQEFCRGVEQLRLAVRDRDRWTPSMEMTFRSAMDYAMDYAAIYTELSECPGWDGVVGAE